MRLEACSGARDVCASKLLGLLFHILQRLIVHHLFFTGSDDNFVCLWDLSTRCEVAKLSGHTGSVLSVVFDGSGQYLASGQACDVTEFDKYVNAA